ncbi:GNAT family N-acetyltransferase [Halovulum sp. GXIMD14793]
MTQAARWAVPAEYDALGQLFHAAVHAEPSPYTKAQRQAWMPEPPNGARWHDRLDGQRVAMVCDDGQSPLGFMTLRSDGYVDLAYILAAARGHGVFRRLFALIEQEAQALGLTHLSTHASLAAQGPFKAVGFEVVRHEVVQRDGEHLKRAEMECRLG